MKRAKRPGRIVHPWWDSGPGYIVFVHPDRTQEVRDAFMGKSIPQLMHEEAANLREGEIAVVAGLPRAIGWGQECSDAWDERYLNP